MCIRFKLILVQFKESVNFYFGKDCSAFLFKNEIN